MSADARPQVAIVDYGMGNRRSVEKALIHVGADAVISGDPEVLAAADALVLPGVGAFPKGMAALRERRLDVLVRERARAGVPLLGICLGMQLLFDSSTEMGHATGLGLIAGEVRALDAGAQRIPHIGWTEVGFLRPSVLTAELPADGAPFYHVHSYVAHPTQASDVIGVAEYGESFTTIVARENIHGVQFHPEKSSRDGLALIAGFVKMARGARGATR